MVAIKQIGVTASLLISVTSQALASSIDTNGPVVLRAESDSTLLSERAYDGEIDARELNIELEERSHQPRPKPVVKPHPPSPGRPVATRRPRAFDERGDDDIELLERELAARELEERSRQPVPKPIVKPHPPSPGRPVATRRPRAFDERGDDDIELSERELAARELEERSRQPVPKPLVKSNPVRPNRPVATRRPRGLGPRKRSSTRRPRSYGELKARALRRRKSQPKPKPIIKPTPPRPGPPVVTRRPRAIGESDIDIQLSERELAARELEERSRQPAPKPIVKPHPPSPGRPVATRRPRAFDERDDDIELSERELAARELEERSRHPAPKPIVKPHPPSPGRPVATRRPRAFDERDDDIELSERELAARELEERSRHPAPKPIVKPHPPSPGRPVATRRPRAVGERDDDMELSERELAACELEERSRHPAPKPIVKPHPPSPGRPVATRRPRAVGERDDDTELSERELAARELEERSRQPKPNPVVKPHPPSPGRPVATRRP